MTKELINKVTSWAVTKLHGCVPVQEIDDIVQTTLILVDKSYKTDTETCIETYATKILMSQIALYLRRNKKHTVLVSMEQVIGVDSDGKGKTIADTLASDDDVQAEYEQFECMEQIMASLSCEEETLIDLYYMNGYSMQEIAEVYGVGKSTISRKISTIIGKLKRVHGVK